MILEIYIWRYGSFLIIMIMHNESFYIHNNALLKFI